MTNFGYTLTVDLPRQTVTDAKGLAYRFEIAPSRKEVLLKALDDIATTMLHVNSIDAYEKCHALSAAMFDPVDIKNYSNGTLSRKARTTAGCPTGR
jgi:3-isopropylmalate dehydratase small subunit